MEKLVQLSDDGQPFTSSRKIAEAFNKPQKTVIQAIENILKSQRCASKSELAQWFKKGTYCDHRGRAQLSYRLSEQGFNLAVSGFTGERALEAKVRFLREFKRMRDFITEYQRTQASRIILSQELSYSSVAEYSKKHGFRLSYWAAAGIGKRAAQITKELGAEIINIPDLRFGSVGLYPLEALKKAFSELI